MLNIPCVLLFVRRVKELCSWHFPCSFLTENTMLMIPRSYLASLGYLARCWQVSCLRWARAKIYRGGCRRFGASLSAYIETYSNSWGIVSCSYMSRNGWRSFSIKADKENILKQWADHSNIVVLYCVYYCSIPGDPLQSSFFHYLLAS